MTTSGTTSAISLLDKAATFLVTGANGMLGRSVCSQLSRAGCTNILRPSRGELDLLDSMAVSAYFANHNPDFVFHLAAAVYGLGGNIKFKFPSLATNTMINHNVLSACAAFKPRKVFFSGSVASYPHPYSTLPLTEDYLTGASPHYGEYGYAEAKLHALPYLTIMQREFGIPYTYGVLTNLYGPHDRFDIEHGHVVPSLVCKVHAAVSAGSQFAVWGDGTATRDFLHVDDASRAVIMATDAHDGIINICSGQTTSIRSVVDILCEAAGYHGEVAWQSDKPTGISKRSVCSRKLQSLGFDPYYTLPRGLKQTFDWYCSNIQTARST